MLVDVGAGVGLTLLAAALAARGHQAIAFELSTISVAFLKASMDYDGFKKAITLHKACSHFALHDTIERWNRICVEPRHVLCARCCWFEGPSSERQSVLVCSRSPWGPGPKTSVWRLMHCRPVWT